MANIRESGVKVDENIAAVMTALEPDQLTSAKQKHPYARRAITRNEKIIFWLLRVYLFFMVGVVIYQVWNGIR